MTPIATVIPTHISGPAEALRRLGASRDAEAWAWLCAELGPQLRSLTGRLSADAPSADDALQETLLTVRDHAGQFRPRQDPDADARHWLLRVAANAALGLARRSHRARLRAGRAPAPALTSASSSERLEREEQSEQLRQALAELGERERTAITLRVLEDLEYRDIAAALGCAEGTVKSLVSRGLRRLRERLGRPELSLLTLGLALPATLAPAPLATSAAALLHAPLTATLRCLPTGVAGTASATLAAAIGLTAVALLAVALPLAWSRTHATPPPAALPVASLSARNASSEPVIPAPAHAAPSDPLLQQKLTFSFADTGMPDVVSYLRQVTGLRIDVDPAVIAPLTVTLEGEQMSMLNVLRWVFVHRHLRVRLSQHVLSIDRALQASTPPTADEISLGPAGVPLSDAPLEVRQRLAQQLHVEFQDTTFSDMMTYIESITNLAVIIDPDLDAGALGSGTLSLDHTPVVQVIALASAQHGLVATWTDGAILISRSPGTPALPHAAQ